MVTGDLYSAHRRSRQAVYQSEASKSNDVAASVEVDLAADNEAAVDIDADNNATGKHDERRYTGMEVTVR